MIRLITFIWEMKWHRTIQKMSQNVFLSAHLQTASNSLTCADAEVVKCDLMFATWFLLGASTGASQFTRHPPHRGVYFHGDCE